MSAVADILSRINALSPAEQAELTAKLPTVTGRPIVATPDICFGRARIDGTRIPVWVLESYRRLGADDAELVENYPSLSVADLRSVWAYVDANRAEIDADIADQERELPLDEFEQINESTWVHTNRKHGG